MAINDRSLLPPEVVSLSTTADTSSSRWRRFKNWSASQWAAIRRASLAREVTWLPAFENRGEGIFLQFSVQAIAGWLRSSEVQSRWMKLAAGCAEWKKEHVGSNRDFPGPAT